jgi:hypothetical protein
VKLLNIPPAVQGPESALMLKSYNEAMYRELKAQGKFHLIEEDIARVRKDLDNREKSKK